MSLGLVATIKEARRTVSEGVLKKGASPASTAGWTADNFACEQIRGLVRRVFSLGIPHPVRQVVFSAAGPGIDISDLCLRTGQFLAEERAGDVALVDRETWPLAARRNLPLKQMATQIYRNFWSVPGPEYSSAEGFASARTYLAAIRSEFEYSIVAAPPAGGSEVTTLTQSADGIVLVLSAQHTRRASAARIKDALAEGGVRLLGAVLTDREFPIPEKLYRRL